jgi:hypothetical protein
MAIDFPNSPTEGNTYISGNKKWEYLGNQKWAAANSGADLLTLINELSTNMQNIGNYPYLEYAYISTLGNTTAQQFAADTETVCTLNTEIVDLGNFGELASNQITLSPGTYSIEVFFLLDTTTAFADATGWIHNVTNNTRITQFKAKGDVNQWLHMETKVQATFNTQTTIELRAMVTDLCYIRNSAPGSNSWSTAVGTEPAQHTTIKLWKVG